MYVLQDSNKHDKLSVHFDFHPAEAGLREISL